MYGMILMAALSGNVDLPACHRRCWAPCYPCYAPCYPVYYSPCVYYVYPCVTVEQPASTAEEESGEEEVSDAPLTPEEEKKFQEYIKEATPEEKAQLTTNAAKRTLIQEVEKALKEQQGKGGADKGDKGDEGDDEQGARPAPATIRVHLPADATLTIDGEATASTSSTRRFVSPPLPRGEGFSYELKAQVRRDGKVVTLTKRVPVQAGQETEVRFDDVPAVSVARN